MHHAFEGFTLIPTILHPRSRGTVKVTTSNPFDHPEVNPNYLSDPQDVKTIVAGVKHAYKLATEHEALSELVAFSAAPPVMNTFIDKGTCFLLQTLITAITDHFYH